MGDAQKSSVGGGDASHKRGTLLIGKAGSHYVILLYCKPLLQVLPGMYYKIFYWIGLFTIYCCFMCLRLAKPKKQLKAS